MVALNDKADLKANFMLRIFGVIIFFLGLLFFLFVGFVLNIKTADDLPEGLLETVKNIIVFRFLVAGIVPLVVGGYFTLMFRVPKDFFIGIFLILPAFIVLHYVVAVFSVYPNDLRYILVQLLETICGVAVIVKYHRKCKLNGS